MEEINPNKRIIQFGPRQVQFPSSNLGLLVDSTEEYHVENYKALRDNMERDGYLFLRGLLNRNNVLEARKYLLEKFSDLGGILAQDKESVDGVLAERCGIGCVPFMEGKSSWTHNDIVLKGVLESEDIKKFFTNFLGGPVLTFDFKWLRAVPKGTHTGAHVDRIYMGRGSENLYTTWIPFGDNPPEMGSLCMLHKSNHDEKSSNLRNTYGVMDMEKEQLDGTGWFTTDPAEASRFSSGQWQTADYQAGDVIIFTMKTIHMSTTNTTDKARISCDVRWQLANEPVDDRYFGTHVGLAKPKAGLYAKDDNASEKKDTENDQEKGVQISDLKSKWGIDLPNEEEKCLDKAWGPLQIR